MVIACETKGIADPCDTVLQPRAVEGDRKVGGHDIVGSKYASGNISLPVARFIATTSFDCSSNKVGQLWRSRKIQSRPEVQLPATG